jgi:hypothetical protein
MPAENVSHCMNYNFLLKFFCAFLSMPRNAAPNAQAFKLCPEGVALELKELRSERKCNISGTKLRAFHKGHSSTSCLSEQCLSTMR